MMFKAGTKKSRRDRRIQWMLAICLGLGLLAPAGAAGSEYAGTAAHLNIGLGARALGMGGTFVAVADDAATVYYNPAGLAKLHGVELTSLYSTEYGVSSYGSVGLAAPSLGLALLRYNSNGIELRDDYGNTIGEFDMGSAAALAGLGIKLGPLAVGANAAYVSESLAQQNGKGLTGSAGVLLDVGPMQVGLVMRNVLGEMKYDNETFPFEKAVVAGGALQTASILLTGEYEMNLAAGNHLRAGAEYKLLPQIALRAGVVYDQQTQEKDLSAGLGIKIAGLKVDYAYMMPAALPVTHRVSVNIKL